MGRKLYCRSSSCVFFFFLVFGNKIGLCLLMWIFIKFHVSMIINL
ncbi:unnamed protein product [Arabidopsis halleri]